MAADSLISQGEHAVYSASPKVWRTPSGLIVGVAGSVDYLAAIGRVPWPARVEDAFAHVRNALSAASVPLDDGEAVVGARGALWSLSTALFPLQGNLAAAGTGHAYALGSLASSAGTPVARVREAVRVASRWCTTVGGRIVVVSSA